MAGRKSNNRAAQADILIADFEGDDYGKWKVEGTAFGTGPAHGTLSGQMAVEGFLGKGLVNSFAGGDDTVGKLTSPPLKIERRYLGFLIGGGGWPETCMNLLVDGKIVRTATGSNTEPGGSERLEPQLWDVSEFIGREAVIEIVDQRKGGRGHINVDQIIQSDNKPPGEPGKKPSGITTNATREFIAEKRLLHFPVKTGARKRNVTVSVDGKPLRYFEIELAETAPDWWAPLDISRWSGRTLKVQVDKLSEDSRALSQLTQADSLMESEDLYREALRAQFHFSPRRGWNNDPNGLVWSQGEFHLYFQQNPYGWNWGNMHWGHAVSRDLVHWEELGEALYPDARGTMFSGSAVVDAENTTGRARGSEKPIVCIYTAAGGTSRESSQQPFTQCVAYSTDRGRTWTADERNPVLPHIVGGNRDPKVIWYAAQKKWVMAACLRTTPVRPYTAHRADASGARPW